MNIAYLDCASGISGDMTLGALVDAGVGVAELNAALDSLGLPGCRLEAQEVRRSGFRGVQVTVHHPPEHVHRRLADILGLLTGSRLAPAQRDRADRVFRRLAEAEAHVHGVPVEEVHFHEVGAVDSIADVVGTIVGLDLLGIERLEASAVPTGSGKIQIAHGVCGIPAPATAELLRGIPLAESTVDAELTTPTGAAILATLVERFGPLPAMTVRRIGCGAGSRDIPGQPNLLRLLVGDDVPEAGVAEQIWVLETNLDDATGETIGYCVARLWEAGALDVYATAVQMKKNRPGVALSVLCRPTDVESLERILFEETPTLGIRRWPASRSVLARRPHRVETPWGPVDGKVAQLPDGQTRFSPEYESCREIAASRSVPLRTIHDAAQRAFDPSRDPPP
ncbi:MAG: nickel pincer cofactor biosynthesis protein LarC [Pirellulales bacterium]|nr:nickel pincer cofactor biosynthesis protein LarC [Pirellulales bacterium]